MEIFWNIIHSSYYKTLTNISVNSCNIGNLNICTMLSLMQNTLALSRSIELQHLYQLVYSVRIFAEGQLYIPWVSGCRVLGGTDSYSIRKLLKIFTKPINIYFKHFSVICIFGGKFNLEEGMEKRLNLMCC